MVAKLAIILAAMLRMHSVASAGCIPDGWCSCHACFCCSGSFQPSPSCICGGRCSGNATYSDSNSSVGVAASSESGTINLAWSDWGSSSTHGHITSLEPTTVTLRTKTSLSGAEVAESAMPDCSKTACPSKCQCAEQECTSQITDCLNDSACAAGQACIDKCACGDKSCLLTCAKSIKSTKALPLAMCLESKCGAEESFIVTV
jgi:hypothetical protein